MEYSERKRLLFFGLPWTFTKYTIGQELVTIKSGLLKTEENDCYIYKIQDVKLETGILERIFRLGTVVCYTGDVTNPTLTLVHIKHARDIKNFVLESSESERRRRRTLNTQDIGADADGNSEDHIF